MAHPEENIRELFRLSPADKSVLIDCIEEKSFRRGERIEARSLMRAYGYYVESGMVRVFYVSRGCEHTFSFALEGEYVVPAHLLLNDPDSVMCIEFLEPTTVILLSHRLLEKNIEAILPQRAREVIEFIMHGLLGHINFLEERVMMFQTATATERYRWMEQRYPRVLERATMTQVASFLGLTKETIYRIRSKKYNKK